MSCFLSPPDTDGGIINVVEQRDTRTSEAMHSCDYSYGLFDHTHTSERRLIHPGGALH